MKPWGNKVAEAAATPGSMTGNEWMYLLSYELLVPLRNAMMFEPTSVTTNETEWRRLTKFARDCHIKTTTVSATPFDKFSTDGIYDVLKNPGQFTTGPSVHNPILQYIEESSADLWCVMTGVMLSESHCPQVWTGNSVAEGQRSTCWESAYVELYGDGAAVTALVGIDTTSGTASLSNANMQSVMGFLRCCLGILVIL